MRHPRDMGASEVEAFLAYLATDRKGSVSTYNQVLSAIFFFTGKFSLLNCPG